MLEGKSCVTLLKASISTVVISRIELKTLDTAGEEDFWTSENPKRTGIFI